jgi:hypothetical protein
LHSAYRVTWRGHKPCLSRVTMEETPLLGGSSSTMTVAHRGLEGRLLIVLVVDLLAGFLSFLDSLIHADQPS